MREQSGTLSSVPKVLSVELLERFRSALLAIDAPLGKALAPGRSDAAIDALLRPLGIELPDEARIWWRWRDGVRPGATDADHMFGWRAMLSLEQAAALYAEERDVWEGIYGVPKLLSPVDEKPGVFFFCGGAANAPVPVYGQNDIDAPAEILPSIGELVDRWTDVMLSGWVSVDSTGRWHYDDDRRPPDQRLIGF